MWNLLCSGGGTAAQPRPPTGRTRSEEGVGIIFWWVVGEEDPGRRRCMWKSVVGEEEVTKAETLAVFDARLVPEIPAIPEFGLDSFYDA